MMCPFVLQWTLGVLVLFPNVLVIVNSRENHDNIPIMKHSVRVSNAGNDTSECLNNNASIACQTLDYVFESIKEQDSTAVYVECGHYTLNKSYTFWHVNQFAVIGLASPFGPDIGEVVIQCKRNAGLAFIHSSGIILKNITLSSCGTIQNSTSFEYKNFSTGLFLVNCIDLSMDRVCIREAPGIGMQLYDVTGIVSISNSHFFNNGKRKKDSLETFFPGGGFYFEFTYKGGLYPFQAPRQHNYQENGTFHFNNVTFEGNTAPKTAETVYPGGNRHNAFGRGGGASFFIKGSAKNNTFIFEYCHFNDNSAEWGAGLFVEFQDNTITNRLIFQSCFFHRNNATYGGGGIRIGLITQDQNNPDACVPNYMKFTFCHFEYNTATLGGGISLYGTTKHSYSLFPNQSYVNFTHCVIKGNMATLGSAFCSALWNTNQYGVGGSSDTIKIYLAHSTIESNEIISEDTNVAGTGALYAQGTPILLRNTSIISNTKTALVLDGASVRVFGKVSFIKNSGQRGGAMSLYGTSKVIVSNNASLSFIENNCSVQGGAIYVKTPGPQMVAFHTTELILHGCFFHFENENCSCSVSFYGNKGPTSTSGHSVYASTLQFCRKPNESIVNNPALEREPYHYYYANGTNKTDMEYEIVTDAINITVDASDWNTTSGKSFSPCVRLSDEKSNSVFGIIKIQVNSDNKVKLEPPSTYFFAKDKIESLRFIAEPKTHYNVSLQTVDSALVFTPVVNAMITGCEPGFVWDKHEASCKCDTKQIAVSRCDDQTQTVFLLKGYWGGYANAKWVFVACPENYCNCNHTNFTSSGECLFDKYSQCNGNREGQICGKCEKNFSLKIGEDECTKECNSGSKKWIGYLVAILLFLTLLVLFIMIINFDPFSAYLNAWLYSYQVLLILKPAYMSFDPLLNFIIGLAHWQLTGFGGICMWSNMDDLQKFAFNYLLPFYVFFCWCVLNKVVATWPNNVFTHRFTQTSLARAFCTLFVLSYSAVVDISLKILYPIQVGKNYYVYYQGTVGYFSKDHAGLAVIALFLVIFVGIFCPLLLIRRQWFKFIDNGLKKLLLDNFQRCFRDGYKWCAGFYFVCRFFLLVIHIAVPRGALQVSLLNSLCCVILAIFVFCQPYTDNGGLVIPYRILNISDAVLLCNLCLISSFGGAASGIYGHSYFTEFKIVIFILSYIPLVFSLGLLAYVLRHRYMTTRRLRLEDVD